ncbi:hypothetical protein FC83_GL002827 [Agrilactobacillus composti DSM 18527 = JCM 14202]|uniref:Uncharacterized protein n=1 Tax=Agrilactobacillus composti DSM 18527 = JCM 14202 TaxID=1423734 RepID=X0PG15_9LACO|nr:hypothetical protein [Agrilactobacillus composti]KRM33436.1 hypothetical protein FC83_GL002827 [Agrilactobacillus composti DSM 18527 = JCM 14202]GAF40773.1 hypothetical protein JCM14202_2680 [Agrilactobacillus composti DSM 18527 = JCM 14202]
MADDNDALKDFPSQEFNAFSTTKMAKFLLYTKNTSMAQLREFFGRDFNTVVKFRAAQLFIFEKSKQIPVEMNKIIVQFPNRSYKVIDADYYHKNFNEPLV